jgi:hypothetical protein
MKPHMKRAALVRGGPLVTERTDAERERKYATQPKK